MVCSILGIHHRHTLRQRGLRAGKLTSSLDVELATFAGVVEGLDLIPTHFVTPRAATSSRLASSAELNAGPSS